MVHHPLDPARYTMVGIAGVVVFLMATAVNEFLLVQDRPPLVRALAVIGASLLLSFGIGMLSGGLQHFDDFPARGAVLVPLGIVVSFVAFVLKDAETSPRLLVSPLMLVVLLVAGASHLGLSTLAAGAGGEASEGGGHSHGGGAAETDDHGSKPESSSPAGGPSSPTVPEETPSADQPKHTGDGHAH
ncbi:hypothetical protein [Streptomyces sp. NK15101]|uniref:hypothetical protein n=1 Tax=Streptomyces sp. NK15101 TaxID=2873261 RepID=UPI001CEDA72C|nr:hypothetical protein [Streptomyces sp. NK15101]